MPGTWLKKKKAASYDDHSTSRHRDVHRSKSSKEVSIHGTGPRRRTATIAAPIRSKSVMNINSTKSPDHYTLERHCKRRPALIQPCETTSYASEPHPSVTPPTIKISYEGSNFSFEKAMAVQERVTLETLLVTACHEQGLEIVDNLSCYSITAYDETGLQCFVDLNAPSTNYATNTIELREQGTSKSDNHQQSISMNHQMTVQDCLDFFDCHDIVEIPHSGQNDDDPYHLPFVEPIEPIESHWEDLPIDPVLKKSLSSVEIAHQQAIWELISTEHSFLKQLEIIINIYMRSLEIIRRQDLLTEVNYHNIFGYMEDIYSAHKQFWSWTLYSCLERVRTQHCLLDFNDIILCFPSEFSRDFEVYEQHCSFETTNLRSLNDAMNCTDFRTYLKWCESKPECKRYKLKDFLAIPRQRLMKYQLLFQAILKKTPSECSNIDELKQIIEEVSLFVDSVNGFLKSQEETSRIENVMKKIVCYSPVEILPELKELVQPHHTHLDLMAPMPDVDVTKPRILVLEGKLRFRDQKEKMVAHVFLFSDMLLITKPVKRNVENYIVVRPPYKISNMQVELRGDSICCIVLNEFRVLSSLFTLKAHSTGIAKEWLGQITSAQEFYKTAIDRKVPTLHILQSLRQERILHGVSQDILVSDPIQIPESRARAISPQLTGTGFRRVASNDSTLSSNSSAFPFDSSPPRTGRRGTISGHPTLRRNCTTPTLLAVSPSTIPVISSLALTPPIWQRTSSLNALLEKKSSDDSNKLMRPHAKLRSTTSASECRDSVSPIAITPPPRHRALSLNTLTLEQSAFFANQRRSRISFSDSTYNDCPPTLEPASLLQESDSTDEEEYPPSASPVNPVSSPIPFKEGLTTTRHRRHKSQPTNTFVIDTSTPDVATPTKQDENEDMIYSVQTVPVNFCSSEHKVASSDDNSLMSEIMKELMSKTDTDINFQEFGENYDSFDSNIAPITRQRSKSLHSDFYLLENRLTHRRRAIQLDNIFESTDEESDCTNTDETSNSAYFTRNTKLRRSKSSFELSFHRRLKPPSPLTTHMKRSYERAAVHPKIHIQTSSPILGMTRKTRNGSSSGSEEDSHKLTKKRNMKVESAKLKQEEDKEKTRRGSHEKKKSPISLFRKGKSLSPTHNKWGMKKKKAVSMEAGLNYTNPLDVQRGPAHLQPPRHKVLSRRSQSSPRVMTVLASNDVS